MPLSPHHRSSRNFQNFVAFWVLGMCNNFAYVIMLSAAKDILSTHDGQTPASNGTDDVCQEKITHRDCSPLSTGSVLLADILPSLVAKVLAPFVMYRVPFGMRHVLVVLLQSGSFIVVAFSNNVATGLAGVVIASAGAGLGEVTYISLSSYFPSRVVTMWSSGTGGAGVLGAFVYAALTDPHMLALSPRVALLSMLLVPAVFAFTYWSVLVLPSSVHRVCLTQPSTYLVPVPGNSETRARRSDSEGEETHEEANLLGANSERSSTNFTFRQKLLMAKPLLRFMIPLSVVYFAEYFINQGLVELLVFDCAHGFSLGRSSQYRWYQVLYQVGVFLSRSSIDCFTVPILLLPLLPALQMVNAAVFLVDTMRGFVPHIGIMFALVFYEGLLGGCAYVNTFSAIHRSVEASKKEFSMGFASMSDSFGILLAGFLAIPAHNYICSHS